MLPNRNIWKRKREDSDYQLDYPPTKRGNYDFCTLDPKTFVSSASISNETVTKLNEIARQRVVSRNTRPGIGTHVQITKQGFLGVLYNHHGISSKPGYVIHYCKNHDGVYSIQETSLDRFLEDQAPGSVLQEVSHPPKFSAEQIVERARKNIGETKYDLFDRNCENFVEWCHTNRSISYQVQQIRDVSLACGKAFENHLLTAFGVFVHVASRDPQPFQS